MSELTDIFSMMKINITETQEKQLNKFYEMLIERNKVMNLTAITEYSQVVIKHYADSAAIANVADMESDMRIIDVGTGAGFPGIVLKIIFPHLSLTLLDSLNKRINFLKEVISELQLEDIRAVHARAEDFARVKDEREKYDLCVSRAVANLSSLSEYCLPFVKVGGIFISYKAENCEEEIKTADKAVKLLGGTIKDIITCEIPASDIKRKFIVVEKKKSTPAKYPRKAGLPAKEPLI